MKANDQGRSQSMRYQGKTALVTGAANGIGRATAIEFAREGAYVILVDNDAAAGEASVTAVCEFGGECEFRAVDVTDSTAVDALFAGLDRPLDVAVNGAAVVDGHALIEDVPFDSFRRTVSVNLEGLFLCMQSEIRLMKRQGYGAIVNIASKAAHEAGPGYAAYCATKHAVWGLTKTAAIECARSGIQINAVSPGQVDAGLYAKLFNSQPDLRQANLAALPTGRFIRVGEVARAILFLASPDAAQIIGQAMRLDGGEAGVEPSTLWHYAG